MEAADHQLVLCKEKPAHAARRRRAILFAVRPDAFKVQQIRLETGSIRKQPETSRVVEKIDELAGPGRGECKSIYEVAWYSCCRCRCVTSSLPPTSRMMSLVRMKRYRATDSMMAMLRSVTRFF